MKMLLHWVVSEVLTYHPVYDWIWMELVYEAPFIELFRVCDAIYGVRSL